MSTLKQAIQEAKKSIFQPRSVQGRSQKYFKKLGQVGIDIMNELEKLKTKPDRTFVIRKIETTEKEIYVVEIQVKAPTLAIALYSTFWWRSSHEDMVVNLKISDQEFADKVDYKNDDETTIAAYEGNNQWTGDDKITFLKRPSIVWNPEKII